MGTQVTAGTPIHPLAWVAGIAVIVFSAVGIAALMGWIPSSIGGGGDRPLAEMQAPVPVVTQSVAPAPVRHVPAAPRPESTAPRASAPVPPAPVASVRCAECGVIASVSEIDTKGQGTGLGAVGGAVVGGLLGSQVGGGKGQSVMTVVGAVGGGFAGNEVEKRVKSTKSYAITIRMDDGTSRVINEAAAPTWHTGDKVRIVNGAIRSNA
jgi:outer membrane lipoprotein SlyB